MKYEVTVVIDKNPDEILEILTSHEHALKWMKGLKRFELVEGEMNGDNSKYNLVFDNNGKEAIMVETIKKISDNEIVAIYEQGPVYNETVNIFRGHDGHTHYTMKNIFKFKWWMALFIWPFKKMFIAQTTKGMNDLKEYVESI